MTRKENRKRTFKETGRVKKKKFNIFDWYYNREKNDAKDDDFNPSAEPSFKNFFKLLWRKLNKLTSCNIFFIFANYSFCNFIIVI